jgi:chromate transporter
VIETYLQTLLPLILRFAVISLFAIGGGTSSIIPLIHDESVRQMHWVDDRAFAELLAIAQATPGPNFMLIPLIAWHVAGWPGAFITLAAFLALPVTIAFVAGRLLNRHDNATVATIRGAFRPVTAGMWMSSGIVIAHTADKSWVALGITALVVVGVLFVEMSPLWWCLGAGVIGALLV